MPELQPRMHVPFADAARTYVKDGYEASFPNPITKEKGLLRKKVILKKPENTEEAVRIYDEFKFERYALTSVLINRVVDRMSNFKETLPPYGLISDKPNYSNEKPEDGVFPLVYFEYNETTRDLGRMFDSTLRYAWQIEMQELEDRSRNSDKSPEVKVFERAKFWEQFLLEYIPDGSMGFRGNGKNNKVMAGTPFTLVPTGVSTAVGVITKLSILIPELFEKSLDDGNDFRYLSPGLYSDTLKRSFPLLGFLASLGGERFNEAQGILSGDDVMNFGFSTNHDVDTDFLPFYFDIVGEKGEERIEIKEKNLLMAKVEKRLANVTPVYSYDSGCPALPAISGPSPIKKLLDLYIEPYKDLYERRWETGYKPVLPSGNDVWAQ